MKGSSRYRRSVSQTSILYSIRIFDLAGSGAPFFAHSNALMDYTHAVTSFLAAPPCPGTSRRPHIPSPNHSTAPLARPEALESCYGATLSASTRAQAVIKCLRQILPDPTSFSQATPLRASRIDLVTYANTYGRFSVMDNLCRPSHGAKTAGISRAALVLASATRRKSLARANCNPPPSGIRAHQYAAPRP